MSFIKQSVGAECYTLYFTVLNIVHSLSSYSIGVVVNLARPRKKCWFNNVFSCSLQPKY